MGVRLVMTKEDGADNREHWKKLLHVYECSERTKKHIISVIEDPET